MPRRFSTKNSLSKTLLLLFANNKRASNSEVDKEMVFPSRTTSSLSLLISRLSKFKMAATSFNNLGIFYRYLDEPKYKKENLDLAIKFYKDLRICSASFL